MQNELRSLVSIQVTSSAPILIKGTVDNSIGDTELSNSGGDILADTARGGGSLVRSNVLNLSTPGGSIGNAGGNYLNVDLVQWDGGPLTFTAAAHGDINLDLLTSARDKGIID